MNPRLIDSFLNVVTVLFICSVLVYTTREIEELKARIEVLERGAR